MSKWSIESVVSHSKSLQVVLLRILLGLLLIVPVGWFGLRLYRSWVQEHEVRALLRIDDCMVSYDGAEINILDFFNQSNSLSPVTWPEAMFGKHFVHRADFVQLQVDRVDEAIPHLKRLPYLRKIEVYVYQNIDQARLEIGAQRIRQAMPRVETEAVIFLTSANDEDRIRLPRE